MRIWAIFVPQSLRSFAADKWNWWWHGTVEVRPLKNKTLGMPSTKGPSKTKSTILEWLVLYTAHMCVQLKCYNTSISVLAALHKNVIERENLHIFLFWSCPPHARNMLCSVRKGWGKHSSHWPMSATGKDVRRPHLPNPHACCFCCVYVCVNVCFKDP